MRKLFSVTALCAVALSAVAAAYAEPVKLEYKYAKGDVSRYVTKFEYKLQLPDISGFPKEPMAFTMSMQQAQKVEAVYPDGTAKIKIWSGDLKMTSSNPKMFPVPKQKMPDSTGYVKMSKLGKVLSIDVPALSANGKKSAKIPNLPSFDFNKLMSLVGDVNAFPAEPMEVGASWNKPFPVPENIGKVELVNTLASTDDQFAGTKAAKINQTLNSTIDLAEAVKAIVKIFAASMPGDKSIEAPPFSGDMNIVWNGDQYLSLEQGKNLGYVGSGKVNVHLKLPAEAVAQGMPAEVSAVLDMNISQTKIN